MGDGCAWWDTLAGECSIASHADYTREASDALDEINLREECRSEAG